MRSVKRVKVSSYFCSLLEHFIRTILKLKLHLWCATSRSLFDHWQYHSHPSEPFYGTEEGSQSPNFLMPSSSFVYRFPILLFTKLSSFFFLYDLKWCLQCHLFYHLSSLSLASVHQLFQLIEFSPFLPVVTIYSRGWFESFGLRVGNRGGERKKSGK